MRWEFHPEALREYQDAGRYYAERDSALALRFIEAIEGAIRRVVQAPFAWPVLDDDVRRCLTHVFPYGVLYSLESDVILVVAVMHCSREPGYWKERVGEA